METTGSLAYGPISPLLRPKLRSFAAADRSIAVIVACQDGIARHPRPVPGETAAIRLISHKGELVGILREPNGPARISLLYGGVAC
jgi:hypothetical protein